MIELINISIKLCFIIFVLVLVAMGMVSGERQELIMLEIQPIIYEKTLVKRSPITQFGQEQQFVQQPAPNAVINQSMLLTFSLGKNKKWFYKL